MSPYNQKSGMILGLESFSVEMYSQKEISSITNCIQAYVLTDLFLLIFTGKRNGQLP